MNPTQFDPPQPNMPPQPQSAPRAKHLIMDAQHGLAAVAFTHPGDWQAQSQLVWNMQHTSMPVQTFARVFNPQTGAMLESFPVEAFYWIEPNMGFVQPGQPSGQGNVAMPPMPAADALIRCLLPKYRGNRPGLQIVSVTPKPQLPQVLKVQPPQGAMQEGVCVKITYHENNAVFDEEFYGLKTAYQGTPSYGAGGMMVQYNWGFDSLFSFRAPQGQIDANRPAFQSIVESMSINPQWKALYARVLQQMEQQFNAHIQAGYANINAATQLSHQISAGNDAFLQHQQERRDYEYQSDQRRRAQESGGWGTYNTTDAFGDLMMGRETVTDPNSETGYSQYSGYADYTWTNPQGEVFRTDNPSEDPNVGSTQQWTLTQKKQVGDRW